MKNLIRYTLSALALITSIHSQAVEVFSVDGFTITCKTGSQARAVGDFPVINPLQFQYTTQDGYSCLIVQLEASKPTQGSARVAVLTHKERYSKEEQTGKTVSRNPNDLGTQGNWEFFYVSKQNDQTVYCFVDYGSNEALKNLFESIKLKRNMPIEQEKSTLQTKAPPTFGALKIFGAQESK